MGERAPHNDPAARSCFIGMTMDTTREDMTQAVLEGVAFGIRDSLEAAKKLGKVKDKVWEPNQDNVEIYNELYEEYKTLHTYFGTGINDVMKHLKNIRERIKYYKTIPIHTYRQ